MWQKCKPREISQESVLGGFPAESSYKQLALLLVLVSATRVSALSPNSILVD